VACGPTKDQAIFANDEMVSKVAKCSNAEKLFFETCKTFNPVTIKQQLKELTEVCKKVKVETEGTEMHKDLAKLKTSTLQLIDAYIKTEPEYTEYARLFSIPNADYTDEDDKLVTTTATKINNTIDMAFMEFNLTQKEFGNKYGYIIESNKKK
jgi:hypothetical protein